MREAKRDRPSTAGGYEEVERRSSEEAVFRAEDNIYEFVVDTESEDECDVETVYEDDVAAKRVGAGASSRAEHKQPPPATAVFCPKPNIVYEYLENTAVEGRLTRMLQYKAFLKKTYPKRSDSVYCNETNVPVHRYDVDVCYDDPFDYKLIELKQTRNKPINFIVIAKPGIDTYKLAAELASMRGTVLITREYLVYSVTTRKLS